MKMRIILIRGHKVYRPVPCGKNCSYRKPMKDEWGNPNYCMDRCHCPKWWFKIGGIDGMDGLHKIGGGK